MTDWMSQLCRQLGVHAQYRGFDGQTISVSPDTQSAVLHALGVDVHSDADAKAQTEHLQAREAAHPLQQEVIVYADQSSILSLSKPAHWTLEAENNGAILGEGKSDAANVVTLPAMPIGIHKLRLSCNAQEFTTWVLARPTRAIQLQDRIPDARIWGGLAALYGLTDGDRAAIGSYALLGDYAAAFARHGADFLGINPVHAMGQTRPDHLVSPYSPTHRVFLNTWHCNTGVAEQVQSKQQGRLVDYPAALEANAQALTGQFAAFKRLPQNSAEKQAFDAFVAQAGAPLDDFALFEALAQKHGADWREWPALLQQRDAATLDQARAQYGGEIAFTKWAQWQAEEQLAQAQNKAQDAGMRVGLYLDLAVGPRLGGAETWEKNTSLVTGASLGAPPDPLGPMGQNWGLAPLSPLTCRAEGYAGFSRLLRAIMRHAGMIRIDHVLGLMRSFWIPDGAREGTYVSYPFDALLAVVAIESVRNNAIVVGEDLGLVPEGLREKLAASGVYGLDVLQYMRSPSGGFVDSAQTRNLAVCTFATHDTPTVAGFFAAEDARVRYEFGGIDAEALAQTQADRARAEETLETSDPVREIHRRLAKANAGMVAVQLDDVAQSRDQQNLPGTIDTYPNWRLKSPFTLNEIATSDAFTQLAGDMQSQGRSNLKGMEKENDLQHCSNDAH